MQVNISSTWAYKYIFRRLQARQFDWLKNINKIIYQRLTFINLIYLLWFRIDLLSLLIMFLKKNILNYSLWWEENYVCYEGLFCSLVILRKILMMRGVVICRVGRDEKYAEAAEYLAHLYIYICVCVCVCLFASSRG